MIKIVPNLSLDKILADCSASSPEFASFIKPYEFEPITPPLGELLPNKAEEPNLRNEAYSQRHPEMTRQIILKMISPQKTLFIFPDTQMYKEHRNLMSSIARQASIKNEPGEILGFLNGVPIFKRKSVIFKMDQLTIVREELEQDGLRRYQNKLPADLYRGENSLLRRCKIPLAGSEEITNFYDIATNSFEKLVLGLFSFEDNSQRAGCPKGEIAQDFMLANGMRFRNGVQQSYHSMFKKLLEKREKGNETNYVADKVLTLTNFGINFFSRRDYRDRSIVLSADNDFIATEDFVYRVVLPKHLAKRAEEVVEKQAPGRWARLGISSKEGPLLEDWARKHIQAGLELCPPGSEKQMTNLIYNCRTGEVIIGYVHPMIPRFLEDMEIGLAKSYVAERSILDRAHPRKIIERLEKDHNKSYRRWLNELRMNK